MYALNYLAEQARRGFVVFLRRFHSYLEDDVRRYAVGQQLVQLLSRLKQPTKNNRKKKGMGTPAVNSKVKLSTKTNHSNTNTKDEKSGGKKEEKKEKQQQQQHQTQHRAVGINSLYSAGAPICYPLRGVG